MSRLNSFKEQLSSKVSAFGRNESGSFATVFGVSAVAVFLCAGVAVDYTRMAQSRSIINSALDAAVLSAGNALAQGKKVDGDLRQEFEDFFMANVEGRFGVPSNVRITSFSADAATGKVSATASADMTMAFMGIAGTPSVELGAASEAVFSNDAVEVAMMLDVTGSMGQNGKLAALKDAAKEAVSILLPDNSNNGKTRISLVPYSAAVNAGPYAARASVNPGFACVTERWGTEKFTDSGPNAGKVEARSAYCPRQSIMPLSGEPASLKSTISSFTDGGSTAGHLGVAWTYYTLSPNWKSVWPTKSKPANYKTKDVRKIAILMTDGEFNTIYGPGWSSATFAEEICRSMRRDEITIYSIGFQAPSNAERTLRNCASPDKDGKSHFFSANSAAELTQAFRDIAKDIQKLRLSM
ncbi:MAG: pilus assembly protein [Rhizobiaceae bacterium]